MGKYFGYTYEPPKWDKKNHGHCPHCGTYISFEESSRNGKPGHSWSCKKCGAFEEHWHDPTDYRAFEDVKKCYGLKGGI